MKDSSRKKMSDFYDNLVNNHGLDIKSLHGKDANYTKSKQETKFSIISKYIKDKDSVLDVGCGLADLNFFLLERNWIGQYNGIDISPKMVEMCNNTLGKKSVSCVDIVEEDYKKNHDIVVSISALQHRPPFEEGDEYIKKIVTKMYDISNEFTIFDVFSEKFTDYKKDQNLYVNPSSFLDFLYTLTPHIDFINTHSKYQIIFVLKKNKN